MKVLVVFGTRPEAIKMCPLILELKKNTSIETIVCLTGQHREMVNPIMEAFGVSVNYNLDIMRARQTLSMITSNILNGMDSLLEEIKPDIILVHGDTTSSFAAGLAGLYHNILVGHVEAGLRTYNIKSPYPEEFNRQTVDLFSNICFAPTELAKSNLLSEGKKTDQIYVTGNTVIDSLSMMVKDDYTDDNIEWARSSRLILLTSHRRENIGRPMHNIFRAIRRIVEENEDIKVIYPIHKNPAVREIAAKYLQKHNRIRMIEPLDVFDFHNYMNKSYLILTDSGGIQEEAPALGKPVLVLRNTTERPEGVAAGTLKLVGTDEEMIVKKTNQLLNDQVMYENMSRANNPYGDGHASERIVGALIKYIDG